MSNNKRLIAKILNGENVIMRIDDNMLSCEFGALDRGSITDVVNWGIYSNRGSIVFVDKDQFFNIYTDKIQLSVAFYLTKQNQEIRIATFDIDSFQKGDIDNEVTIELISKTNKLQIKRTNGINYVFDQSTAYRLLGLSENSIYQSYGLSVGEEYSSLKNTVIYCPYLEEESAWSRISKFCQATMCRVFDDEYGTPTISGSFPLKTPIVISPNNILNVYKKGLVRVANSTIDLTNRKKYSNKKLEQASQSFTISYDEEGEPFEISNVQYSFSEGTNYPQLGKTEKIADLSAVFHVPYKIYRCDYSYSTKNTEFLDRSTGETKNYSTTGRSGQVSLIGNDYEHLHLKDEFSAFRISSSYEIRVKGLNYYFYLSYFEDSGTTQLSKITNENQNDLTKIESNDLIQDSSFYYLPEDGTEISLGEHILEEVKRRYSKGIECFEMECLFNDYYNENGKKVFDKSDLSKHFKRYDVVIPYVQKNGKIIPLSSNSDGTPKKFRIIGISYLYDGLLRQKLQLQEERYDVD